MKLLDNICSIVLLIFILLNCYDILYLIIGFFFRAKSFPDTDKRCRYAFVIPARNEEKVIGRLLESIHKQDYFESRPVIFVVADNCTDSTADVCRRHGAVVYERHDSVHARKGYALEYLFSKIDADFGILSFDGYFIFDADNLLAPDFVTEMNKAFASGAEVVTSYRNTKNFETNIVSSAYGIHFFYNTVSRHRPRSILNLGTHLTGTGFLISSRILKDGWHCVNLTEDDEMTMKLSASGIKVEYCEAAEFYDEQPCDFDTSLRQRARWARGRLVAFAENGLGSLAAIFKFRKFTNYDLFFHYFPYGLLIWLFGVIYPVSSVIYDIFSPAANDYTAMLRNILGSLGALYLRVLLGNVLTVIREWKHIRCPDHKLIFYVLTSPWFAMISVYIYIAALFADIKWTPIAHIDRRGIEDLEEGLNPAKPAKRKTIAGGL